MDDPYAVLRFSARDQTIGWTATVHLILPCALNLKSGLKKLSDFPLAVKRYRKGKIVLLCKNKTS
jgi:hypothetical protein